MNKQQPPWFEIHPVLIENLQIEVIPKYTNLNFRIIGKTAFLSGSFAINHKGEVLDRFLIDMEFPSRYPKGVPVVREINGRIPWTNNRHVFPTGVACLFFPYELASVYPENTSLIEFLDGAVRNYFISQSIFEKTGEWPFGQWAHGVKAKSDFYASVLGTNDLGMIRRFMNTIQGKKIKGHWLCPCGSGNKLRNCHFELLIKLQRDYYYAKEQYPWSKTGLIG